MCETVSIPPLGSKPWQKHTLCFSLLCQTQFNLKKKSTHAYNFISTHRHPPSPAHNHTVNLSPLANMSVLAARAFKGATLTFNIAFVCVWAASRKHPDQRWLYVWRLVCLYVCVRTCAFFMCVCVIMSRAFRSRGADVLKRGWDASEVFLYVHVLQHAGAAGLPWCATRCHIGVSWTPEKMMMYISSSSGEINMQSLVWNWTRLTGVDTGGMYLQLNVWILH